MKSFTLITSILVLLFFTAHAQQGKKQTAENRAENLVDRLEKMLKLSDKQEDLLENVFENSFKEINTIRKNNPTDKSVLDAALQKNQEVTNGKVEKILSTEQFQKYLTWQKQCKAVDGECNMKSCKTTGNDK